MCDPASHGTRAPITQPSPVFEAQHSPHAILIAQMILTAYGQADSMAPDCKSLPGVKLPAS